MARMLEGLMWSPKWVSHLGCIKGCVDYLKLGISDAWLYGGTGHAFVINISKDSCPSGPTAWKTEMLFVLGSNLGYSMDGNFAHKSMPDFGERRRKAWEHVKQSIDEGYPCYGWELDIAEFYVINGYDERGYYFNGPGCEEGKGPKPWDEVGETQIGMFELYSVRPGKPASDEKTVKEALEFTLEHSKGPEKWIFPNYSSGPAGYDTWINGIQEGIASASGLAYNAAVWGECRHHAVEFLRESKGRIEGLDSEFDEAIEHYSQVSDSLKTLMKIYPFKGPADFSKTVEDPDKRAKATSLLGDAREAEESGLQTLEKIIEGLSS
jgi:hypothetical protein